MKDIRDDIFRSLEGKRFRAALTAERDGCLSGAARAVGVAAEIGVELELLRGEGESLREGEVFARLAGTAKQIAVAEERLIGVFAKYSGIATAARRAMELAEGRVRVVCGSWKKMPPETKDGVRAAILAGGGSFRICDGPMLYLDKNFIRMFGSMPATLAAVRDIADGHTVAIQLRGEGVSIEEETRQALDGGADILMVDTGAAEDVDRCIAALNRLGARERVRVAFAGGVLLKEIPQFARREVDTLCVGKEIVDAPLLDMRLDIEGEVAGHAAESA